MALADAFDQMIAELRNGRLDAAALERGAASPQSFFAAVARADGTTAPRATVDFGAALLFRNLHRGLTALRTLDGDRFRTLAYDDLFIHSNALIAAWKAEGVRAGDH